MSYFTQAQRNGQEWARSADKRPPQHVCSDNYQANIYRDADTGRDRWAVLHKPSATWYFPKHYGMKAAAAMARRMNRNAT